MNGQQGLILAFSQKAEFYGWRKRKKWSKKSWNMIFFWGISSKMLNLYILKHEFKMRSWGDADNVESNIQQSADGKYNTSSCAGGWLFSSLTGGKQETKTWESDQELSEGRILKWKVIQRVKWTGLELGWNTSTKVRSQIQPQEDMNDSDYIYTVSLSKMIK